MAERLIPEQRRRAVVDLLASESVVRLSEIADRLGVSVMTVRRDVAALEAEGAAVAVTGGVKLGSARPPVERSERAGWQTATKRAIARRAAELVTDDAVIYLDAGTTCQLLAEHLAARQGLTVVTNDLLTAVSLLPARGINVIHVGGEVDAASGSTAGPSAAQAVEGLSIDYCFLSTGAWSTARGVTTTTPSKAQLKRAAAEAAEKVILLADSSKLGLSNRYRVRRLSEIDAVITDDQLADTAVAELRSLLVRVETATADRARGH